MGKGFSSLLKKSKKKDNVPEPEPRESRLSTEVLYAEEGVDEYYQSGTTQEEKQETLSEYYKGSHNGARNDKNTPTLSTKRGSEVATNLAKKTNQELLKREPRNKDRPAPSI